MNTRVRCSDKNPLRVETLNIVRDASIGFITDQLEMYEMSVFDVNNFLPFYKIHKDFKVRVEVLDLQAPWAGPARLEIRVAWFRKENFMVEGRFFRKGEGVWSFLLMWKT